MQKGCTGGKSILPDFVHKSVGHSTAVIGDFDEKFVATGKDAQLYFGKTAAADTVELDCGSGSHI